MKSRKRLRSVGGLLAVLAVVSVAAGLRLRAVDLLPQDYDEPVYFLAGQHYARAMLAGDWRELQDYAYNLEHPPLGKLAYGVTLALLPQIPEIPEQPTNPPPPVPYPLPQPQFIAVRLTSMLFGVLEVLALAVLNPLAGLLLSIQTFTIKYTSQAYLEALPALLSMVAVLAYVRSKARWNGWLLASAVALGLTAASKYLYCVAGVAIAVHWLWTQRPEGSLRRGGTLMRWLGPVMAWGLLALTAFVAADPFLWPDPVGRLKASILFNAEFSQSQHVQQANLPVWQPFVWLMTSVPWHPGVFVVGLDVAITVLALAGFPRLWRERSVFAVWLIVGLGFLLLWPTKWPQYILVLTAPLSLAAAVGFRATLWEPSAAWLGRLRMRRVSPVLHRRQRYGGRELRRAFIWLLPGAVILGLIALYPMIYQTAMSLTDFGATAIKDGLNGGVWREVWRGLTGQVDPVATTVFGRSTAREVHYAGAGVFLQLLSGAASELVVYEVIWTVLAVVLQTGLGLAVALMLNRPGVRFRGWWRALFILPWAIPEFVGALSWAQIFDPRFGWLSLAGASFSQRADFPLATSLATRWQQDPQVALVVVLLAATWYGFPFMMLAATAGLKLVPGDVYEAAVVDGASRWQQFKQITWPLLLPLLLPAVIIRAIFTFNQFYLYYALNTPFPATTLAITSFYYFNFGGQYAVSATINLFTVLVLVVLILWFNRRSRAAEGVTYA
jgi:ABC-type sugar transport system permease subunit